MAQVFQDIANLKANRARLTALEEGITKLKALAESMRHEIHTQTTNYDPAGFRHRTGSHGDPTATQALKDIPDDVKEIYEDIRSMTIEKSRLMVNIELAENAISLLPEKERIVIEQRLIEGKSWFDVVDGIADQTGELISEKAARNRYNSACEKLRPFFDDSRIYHVKHYNAGKWGIV